MIKRNMLRKSQGKRTKLLDDVKFPFNVKWVWKVWSLLTWMRQLTSTIWQIYLQLSSLKPCEIPYCTHQRVTQCLHAKSRRRLGMRCFNDSSRSPAVEHRTWMGTARWVNVMEGASQSVRNIRMWIVTHSYRITKKVLLIWKRVENFNDLAITHSLESN